VTLGAAVQGVPPDSLRDAVAEVFARPEYRWTTGQSVLEWLAQLVGRLLDALTHLQRGHPAAFRLLLVALVAALVGLLAHMAYVVWRITRPTARTPVVAAAAARPPDQAAAHRARAEQLARGGRYAEALAHRFVAILLDLDQRRALDFRPSKTPAEYVGEARLDASGRASFANLVGQLYRHVFGGLPCDERAYRQFAAQAEFVFEHVAPT
jgi:Domain of unknown function (DUF4129)